MSEPIKILPLKTSNLTALGRRGIQVPDYRRDLPTPRIVHVGVGGFHRSHMALYTDELARLGSPWRICGLGLLPGDQRMSEVLAAQDHLYTLIERQSEHVDVTVIGSITEYCLFASDLEGAAQRIADRDVEIVSLTITEGGYATDPTDPDDAPPALATIVRALELRRGSGGGPLTVLSCDNLPGNGDVARTAVLSVASSRSEELARWIEDTCTFPNSMVDRITPVTADTDRAWLRDTHGIDDQWPVVGETFRQWVIEDRFAVSRPQWEQAGALFTDDVHVWELYKLRMLNAAHSSMAYLCSLAGIEFVDEGIADPAVRQYLERFLADEAIPTLAEIPGHPRQEYAATVLERFGNTGVRDQISRLCIDGTAKYPIFLIPTVSSQLAMNGPIDLAALALAGWARYLAVVPAEDQAFDASADRARSFALRAIQDPLAFLDFADVFPADVRDHPRFRAAFAAASRMLADGDPRAAMMC